MQSSKNRKTTKVSLSLFTLPRNNEHSRKRLSANWLAYYELRREALRKSDGRKLEMISAFSTNKRGTSSFCRSLCSHQEIVLHDTDKKTAAL